jgi:hypothetical protein
MVTRFLAELMALEVLKEKREEKILMKFPKSTVNVVLCRPVSVTYSYTLIAVALCVC